MSQAILEHVTKSSLKAKVPVLKPGYTVRVLQKIKEGEKVRTQVFEGLIIRLSSGSGVNKTFTVRKIVQGVGVEKMFPLHSPFIEKIDIVKKGKVRRAKLYYMRDLEGKSTRLRDQGGTDVEEIVQPEEPVVEEAVTEEAPVEETAAEEPKTEEAAPEETPAEEPKTEEKEEEKS
ncbi:MAG: 50S ribosomal protein L19 [Patescibacteria group bacterium]